MNKMFKAMLYSVKNITRSNDLISNEKHYSLITQNDMPKSGNIKDLCSTKKLTKRNLLIRVALMGILFFGVLLLVGQFVDKSYKEVAVVLPSIFENTHLLLLSELELTQHINPIIKPNHHARSKDSTAKLKKRLRDLRMHNILRKLEPVNPINNLHANNTTKHSKDYIEISDKSANLQRMLVKSWENEFTLKEQ